MKFLFLFVSLVATIAFSSCSASIEYADQNSGISDEARYLQLTEGESYEIARSRLLDNNWIPTPAKCSERSICFKQPEMATDLSSNRSCGVFSKNNRLIEICITPVPDGLLIKSVEFKAK